jgi:hypothetical protein
VARNVLLSPIGSRAFFVLFLEGGKRRKKSKRSASYAMVRCYNRSKQGCRALTSSDEKMGGGLLFNGERVRGTLFGLWRKKV